MPGSLNHGADMLSRGNVALGEWTLHPHTVQEILSVLGKAEVDLFALLPQVIKQVRETKCSVLLVAPLWRNQAWFPELVQLSVVTPW